MDTVEAHAPAQENRYSCSFAGLLHTGSARRSKAAGCQKRTCAQQHRGMVRLSENRSRKCGKHGRENYSSALGSGGGNPTKLQVI